jgi:hypothetical protein
MNCTRPIQTQHNPATTTRPRGPVAPPPISKIARSALIAFTELFEIAGPGKEFEKYSGAHFRRVKDQSESSK